MVDDYTQSFQDFMLGRKASSDPSTTTTTAATTTATTAATTTIGSAATTPNDKHNISSSSSSIVTIDYVSPSSAQKRRQQHKQQAGSIAKAFLGRLEEWKRLDGELHDVIRSIHNLRKRIVWEQQELNRSKNAIAVPAWRKLGVNVNMTSDCITMDVASNGSSGLSTDDAMMALSADLCRHERMIGLLRNLGGSLSQAQDSMGRRLDEWLQLEYNEDLQDLADGIHEMLMVEDDHQDSQKRQLLCRCEHVFVMIAEELYAKQLLLQKMLDSYDDSLLVQEGGDEADAMLSNSVDIAKVCVSEWPSIGRQDDWWLLDG